MWQIVQVVCVCSLLPLSTSAKSISVEERSDNSDLPDASQLIEEFYNTIEEAVHHVIFSRDMHKLIREKRQLDNFGGGNFGQGSFGGFGQGGGLGGGLGGGAGGLFGGQDILGGISNVASLASLDALGSGAASGLPVLSGIGQVNRVVKTVVGLDRMRCASRLACEYMANRGLFNRTSALVPPTIFPQLPANAQGALNLSHPSTFRVLLGALQLVRFQEFGAYDPIEAGLWGVAHRDQSRCRTQFTKCPSSPEAFITELNSTPGGLQSMVTNSLQTIRNTLPGASDSLAQNSVTGGLQTAANVADLGSAFGSIGQQTGSALGSLAGLGALGGSGSNQQFLNPSGSQFGNQQLLGAQFGGNQQFLNPSSGSQFDNQQLLGSQFGGNQQFLNPSSGSQFGNQQLLGSQFGNQQLLGSQFGGNQQFLNPANLQLGGNQQLFNPSSSSLLGTNQQFSSSGISQFGGLATNFPSTGLSGTANFNPASIGLNGASSGFGGLNGLSGVNSLGSLGLGQNGANFGGATGLNNFNGLVSASGLTGGSHFGSQFANQGFHQSLTGNFRSEPEEDNNRKQDRPKKWKWSS